MLRKRMTMRKRDLKRRHCLFFLTFISFGWFFFLFFTHVSSLNVSIFFCFCLHLFRLELPVFTKQKLTHDGFFFSGKRILVAWKEHVRRMWSRWNERNLRSAMKPGGGPPCRAILWLVFGAVVGATSEGPSGEGHLSDHKSRSSPWREATPHADSKINESHPPFSFLAAPPRFEVIKGCLSFFKTFSSFVQEWKGLFLRARLLSISYCRWLSLAKESSSLISVRDARRNKPEVW